MDYQLLPIDWIKLDKDNPRIKQYIEMYGDNVTSEGIALALSFSAGQNSHSSYEALKESIRVNKGIIQPILVNKTADDRYIVIEGNTRVQIYREFLKRDSQGPWNKIIAIVYDNLPVSKIHAIRLQCHLVGARDWDPYSKAKYLHQLSNIDHLPINEIVSYCGGKGSEINKLINAYCDMKEYYEPIAIKIGEDLDPREFSKFSELQNKVIIDSLILHQYTKADFAKWVVNGNIDTAQNVRKLPQILNNEIAHKEFLKTNISEAVKYLHANKNDLKQLESVSMYDLAYVLTNKIRNITFKETKSLKYDPEYNERKSILEDLQDILNETLKDIEAIGDNNG